MELDEEGKRTFGVAPCAACGVLCLYSLEVATPLCTSHDALVDMAYKASLVGD